MGSLVSQLHFRPRVIFLLVDYALVREITRLEPIRVANAPRKGTQEEKRNCFRGEEPDKYYKIRFIFPPVGAVVRHRRVFRWANQIFSDEVSFYAE